MAYLKIKNRAFSTLAADINSTATSLSVAAGEGAKFPSAGDFHITIEDEILKCTAITTDTLTVTRAQEGTTAAAHSAGKSVELRITAKIIQDLMDRGFRSLSDAPSSYTDQARKPVKVILPVKLTLVIPPPPVGGATNSKPVSSDLT